MKSGVLILKVLRTLISVHLWLLFFFVIFSISTGSVTISQAVCDGYDAEAGRVEYSNILTSTHFCGIRERQY